MAGLSQTQKSMITKARTLGSGSNRVRLDDAASCYLLAVIVEDLGLREHFPEIAYPIAPFFTRDDLQSLRIEGLKFLPLIERLCGLDPNADTYFVCLAGLHKRRLKFQRILRQQAIPSRDQVGPRGLLQFGSLSPQGLASLLFWRKWIYDTDNRAAQETGYLFEPIIAHAMGGSPVAQTKSPIRRQSDSGKGRQVDCILGDQYAYEMKLRVTIAASGQGRWGEELQFPRDCRESGYTPGLIVFDPTENPKLNELAAAFRAAGGEVHIGEDAWQHLDDQAGPTMSVFLDRYVREPIAELLAAAPDPLPDITFRHRHDEIEIKVGNEALSIPRTDLQQDFSDEQEIPEDADDQIPGPG